MKLKDYKEDLKKLDERFKPKEGCRKLSEQMLEDVEIWSNDACRGYIIKAAELLEMDPATIQGVVYKLSRVFDDYTITEAEQIYINSPY